jgi:hypothetical protein
MTPTTTVVSEPIYMSRAELVTTRTGAPAPARTGRPNPYAPKTASYSLVATPKASRAVALIKSRNSIAVRVTTVQLDRQPVQCVCAPSRPQLKPITVGRTCSITGKQFTSYYVPDNHGNVFYARSAGLTYEMELALRDVIRENTRYRIERVGMEQCPHCGTYGLGAIECGTCHAMFCFGSQIETKYSRCPCCKLLAKSTLKSDPGEWGIRV